jgi:hypothetical protein
MLNINIKPKAIPQGYKKADLFAEILQIHSIIPEEIDSKAHIIVSLCTAQKKELTRPAGEGSDLQIGTGEFQITGVGGEVCSAQLEYVNPDYSAWVKDEDLIAFVCKELEVEVL